MIDLGETIDLIKKVAEEQGYTITDGDFMFEVYFDTYHSVAFQISANKNSGYIEVKQWEEGDGYEASKFGRCVYSIRTYSGAIHFCNILMASVEIRAKKPAN